VRSQFPSDPRRVLEALRAGQVPDGDGVILL
jgi:hypothetical protein